MVVVAPREHRRLYDDHLRARGHDPEALRAQGALVAADAQATLDVLLDGAMPSREAFEREVNALLDAAAAPLFDRRLRVVGEMVDLLVQSGRRDAAAALEELWRDLARRRSFSLLCAYRLDPFDRETQARLLPAICGAHSHVLPAPDEHRFARAVDRALEQVLGGDEAGKVYVLAAEAGGGGHVPMPQLVLMWLSAEMPATAERVLAAAREHWSAAA